MINITKKLGKKCRTTLRYKGTRLELAQAPEDRSYENERW